VVNVPPYPSPADITAVMGDIAKLPDASITGMGMPAKSASVRRESLAGFVRRSAPHHGFNVLPDGGLHHESKGQQYFLHEVASPDMGSITEQVVANLTMHRTALHRKLHSAA